MKITTIAVAALSLALLAACGKNDQRPASSGSSTAPRNEAAPQSTPSAPVTSSVNSGKTEKTPPVTGREDTREPAQRKDFETNGK